MDGLTLAHVASLGGMAGVVCIGIAALLRRRTDRTERVAQSPMKRTRLIGTSTARDANGRVVALSHYQQYLDAGTWNNPAAERLGAEHPGHFAADRQHREYLRIADAWNGRVSPGKSHQHPRQ